jgi:dTDP-glucose pyrophosphorylase
MRDWQQILVSPETSILEALEVMDKTAAQILLVADATRKLLGTITDGDIRRGILRGTPLANRVADVMNPSPVSAPPDMDEEAIYRLMSNSHIRHLPVVDEAACIVNVLTLDEVVHKDVPENNWVVIMAGGLGTRLHPLTQDVPKPLLRVGNKPILETIIENLYKQRFHKFYISVNYKGEMVKAHFGDGRRWNVNIRYLEEQRRLGTAGALGLIEELPEDPVIVMNGDLLTTVNFRNMLNFHKEQKAAVTVGVREYEFQVPFGVVTLKANHVTSIAEKPSQRFLVNAGIYVFNPETLARVNSDDHLDMPAFLERLLAEEFPVSAFPIREFWLDVGRLEDFKRAEEQFSEFFG